MWSRDSGGIEVGVSVSEQLMPTDNPNHLHVRVSSTEPHEALLTKDANDVYYTITRRLATRYRLWWGVPNPGVIGIKLGGTGRGEVAAHP